MNEAVKACIM